MIYICKHFIIQELVDEHTYIRFHDDAWQFFNVDALKMIDGIREYFDKPVFVNNWDMGGENQFRGLRPSYVTIGAVLSLHKFGGAFDMTIKGVPAEEVRQEILANKNHELLKYINSMERDVPWLHADVRNISDRIKMFGGV